MSFRHLSVAFYLLVAGTAIAAEHRLKELASPQAPAEAYSNSQDGLQKLLGDILSAVKEKNSPRETELIRSLLMPEDATWFTDEYGPGFGASLAAAYRKSVPEMEQRMEAVFEGNVEKGLVTPRVLSYADPEKVNAPIDHFLNCMNQIVPLYQMAFGGYGPAIIMSLKPGAGARQSGGDPDGYFTYYQGTFRFIPSNILMKLPNERPVRIHLDMNTMRSKVIREVYAEYPEEARNKRIGGKVIVRVDLDRGGNIQEAKVLEGNPILAQALLTAVKQWQFLPTRLDGDPVEVEVDVETVFEIH